MAPFFQTGFSRPVATCIRCVCALGAIGLAVSAPPSAAADPLADDRFSHVGVADGLPGRVLDIAQDPQGFLWFAMLDGLRQYDGSRVTSHVHDPSDPGSLSDSYARRLLVDSGGTLWIATGKGRLDRWFPGDESFRSLDLDLGGLVADLEEIGPGRFLAVMLETKPRLISVQDERMETVAGFDSVTSVVVDPSRQVVWGFGRRGLTEHSIGDLSEQRRTPWPESFATRGGLFLDATLGRDGSLWGVAYREGAVRIRPDTGDFEIFHHSLEDGGSLIGDDLTSVLEDSRGDIWIGGFSGLSRYRSASATFERFVSSSVRRRSLVSEQVHALFEDQTGQLWVATDSGAARFDPYRESFLFYSHDPTQEGTVPEGSIRSFAEDDEGRLWVGTRSHGIARMDRRAGETLYYSPEAELDQGEQGRRGLPDPTAWALSYEAPDHLWIGGEEGLYRLAVETGALEVFNLSEQQDTHRVVTLFRDGTGSLWAGNDIDLYRRGPSEDAFERIPLGVESRTLAMVEDSRGRLFVGSEEGDLWALDTRDGSILKHWPAEELAPSKPAGSGVIVLVTIPGEPEVLWAATLGHGLFRLEPDDTWSHFGTKDGLPSTSIRAMEAEPGGTLWLSSGTDTYRFDPATGITHSFQSDDGLPSWVDLRASFRSRSGEIFFGGQDGFVGFFPESIRVDDAPPKVVLADFRIGAQSVRPQARQPGSPLEKSITLAEDVTLKHSQNEFSIELAALHFGDTARNRFAYRLEGVDADWVEASAERSFARYSQIPAGRYLFRAKAANRDGVWSAEEAQLRVRILPAPWLSWWAWSLYTAAVVGLVTWWVRSKIAYLNLEKELQEQELKVLRGLLPICASCKKIRDGEGEWETLETYLNTHSDAQLSHGICPECANKFYAEIGITPGD
ncbi:MAG: two-component regulator propeller domain-containing protein [Acidobacteriota bacterium]